MSPCPVSSFPYVIQPGDTFYGLAQRFNTTPAAIAGINPMVDFNNLQIGQVICIPGTQPSPCPPGSVAYTIKAGDTYYKIAYTYNTTVGILTMLNPGVDPNNLYIGQVICVPHVPVPVPPGQPCSPGLVPYTIRPGDTLYSIAIARRTTVSAIMYYNPGLDPYYLQVGRIICVP